MRCASIAILLLLTAGCGGEQAGPPAAAPSRVETQPSAEQPAAEAAAPATPQSEPAAASAAEPPSVETPPTTTPTPPTVARPEAPATSRTRPAAAPADAATPTATAEPAAEPAGPAAPQPAAATAATAATVVDAPPAPRAATPAAPIAPVAPIAPIAPSHAAPPAAGAELDLKALQDQLRQTKAIGFMTKLTLKGQVDDLLDRFHEYYQGKAKLTMKDLRRSYDLLMMKVLSLLQDTDQQLASAIVASREAIWGLLADPVKFETLQG